MDWRPNEWEQMGPAERWLRVITLVLAAACLVALFVLAADGGAGSTSPVTWWLLVAASASQLGASLSSRRRVPPARFWIQVVVFTAVTALFAVIAIGESGARACTVG